MSIDLPDHEPLRRLVKLAEDAYDRMYDAPSSRAASTCYADAKDYFCDAIAMATSLGFADAARALEARLAHVKAVFRGQFA